MAKKKENPYQFYVVIIQTAAGWHANLKGLNGEVVFTQEANENKKDVVSLVKAWFPDCVIVIKKLKAKLK